MAVIVNVMNDINNFFNKHGDPRTKDFPLMSSPFYTIALTLAYIIGPNYMRHRKAFSIRYTMIIYNLIQVLFSAYLFYSVLSKINFEYYLKCQPVDRADTPLSRTFVSVTWWYFFSKFPEFLDTIFFIMRKKFNQVSTLHVIHHGVMPLSAWLGCKVAPGGQASFGGFLNLFVHIVMYSYYMMCAFGPTFQKYLWLKKYITLLQIFQFVIAMIHVLYGLYIDCFHARGVLWYLVGLYAMFLFLFSDFYRQTYVKKRSMKVEANGDHKNGYIQVEKDKYRYRPDFQHSSDVRRRTEILIKKK